MWRIWRAPNNASKWQMGLNSAFKGLMWFPNTEDKKFVYLVSFLCSTVQLPVPSQIENYIAKKKKFGNLKVCKILRCDRHLRKHR